MPIHDVPSEKWRGFCEAFVRDHAGERVSLEIASSPRGAFGSVDQRIEYPQAALQDIILDKDGATAPSLTVAVVGEHQRQAHHQIRAVRNIRLEQPEPVTRAAGQLLIEGEDGTSLRLMLACPLVRNARRRLTCGRHGPQV